MKAVDQFSKKGKGLQPKCKSCCRDWNASYYARTREVQIEQARIRYQSDPAPAKARARAWVAENPTLRSEIMACVNARLRAERSGAAGDGITPTQWRELLDRAGRRCVYCGRASKLTLDHFVPLDAGGRHELGNITPACQRCNSSKGAGDPHEWMSRNCEPGRREYVREFLAGRGGAPGLVRPALPPGAALHERHHGAGG